VTVNRDQGEESCLFDTKKPITYPENYYVRSTDRSNGKSCRRIALHVPNLTRVRSMWNRSAVLDAITREPLRPHFKRDERDFQPPSRASSSSDPCNLTSAVGCKRGTKYLFYSPPWVATQPLWAHPTFLVPLKRRNSSLPDEQACLVDIYHKGYDSPFSLNCFLFISYRPAASKRSFLFTPFSSAPWALIQVDCLPDIVLFDVPFKRPLQPPRSASILFFS
jgi:hypothetical protein